jgi:hypothetical protein
MPVYIPEAEAEASGNTFRRTIHVTLHRRDLPVRKVAYIAFFKTSCLSNGKKLRPLTEVYPQSEHCETMFGLGLALAVFLVMYA